MNRWKTTREDNIRKENMLMKAFEISFVSTVAR